MALVIAQHLRNSNYTRQTQIRRLFWGLCRLGFRLIPTPFYGARRLLLRLNGAQIGSGVRVYPSVRVAFPWNLRIADQVVVGPEAKLYALAPITIEANVLISQGAHLCAGSHDYRQPNFPTAHRPIRIESGSWIAAEAFIGPGVTVGPGTVIGARAVVTRDIPGSSVAVGNPARVVKTQAVNH